MLYSESYFASRLQQACAIFTNHGRYAQSPNKTPREILQADLQVFSNITKLINADNINQILVSLDTLITTDWTQLNGKNISEAVSQQNLASRTKLALIEHLRSCEARRKLAAGIKDPIRVDTYTTSRGENLSLASVSLSGLKTDLSSDELMIGEDGSPLVAIICSGKPGSKGDLERNYLAGKFAASYYANALMESASRIKDQFAGNNSETYEAIRKIFDSPRDNLDMRCGDLFRAVLSGYLDDLDLQSCEILNTTTLNDVFLEHKYGAKICFDDPDSDAADIGFEPVDSERGFINGFDPEQYLLRGPEGDRELDYRKIAPELNQYFLNLLESTNPLEFMELFKSTSLGIESRIVDRYMSKMLKDSLVEGLKGITSSLQKRVASKSQELEPDFELATSLAMVFDLGSRYALINIGHNHAFAFGSSSRIIEDTADLFYGAGIDSHVGIHYFGEHNNHTAEQFETVPYHLALRTVKKSDCVGIVLGGKGSLQNWFIEHDDLDYDDRHLPLDDRSPYYRLDERRLQTEIFDECADAQDMIIRLLNDSAIGSRPLADETLLVITCH